MMFKRTLVVLFVVIAVFFSFLQISYNVSHCLMYREYIMEASKEYNIAPSLIMAMINTESKFDKNATSGKGAMGLMQMTASTAVWVAKSMGMADFETDDLYDPETNIKMGSWYINSLREKFDTTEVVLAAYNAGQGNVKEWLNNPDSSKDGHNLRNIPYDETSNYVKKVLYEEKMYQVIYKIIV